MAALKDEIGKKYGYLTVLEQVKKKNNSHAAYKCQCKCGNISIVLGTDLRSGKTTSCGCKRSELKHPHNLELIGKKFGKLTILEPAFYNGEYYWKCQCECGNIIETCESNLKHGHSTQCTQCGHKESGKKRAAKLILPGDKFGRVTVIEKIYNTNPNNTKARYNCQCECGSFFNTTGDLLRKGITTSCGCYRKEKFTDLSIIGKKFGMLTILDIDRIDNNRKFVKCQCECGNICIKRYDQIKCGDVHSCGCLKKSFGEKRVSEVLNKLSINNEREYKFYDLLNEEKTANLRFDSAIKSKDGKILYCLIEFDGIHHYKEIPFFKSSLQRVQNHDKIKNDYCKKHNIPLLRIPYWEFNNIETIITNYLKTNFDFLL